MSTDSDFIKKYGWRLLTFFCTVLVFVWAASDFSSTVKANIHAVEVVTTRHENDIVEIRASIKDIAKVVEQQTLNMVEVQTHFKWIREKLEKE